MKITPDHLLDLSIRAARRGNTRAMAQAAQASGATCYTITEREAARVRREYGVEAHSLSGYRPEQEAGRRTPVLLDVAVLPAIAEAWSAEVGAAEQRARQLVGELATSKAAHARDQKHLQRALAELEKLRTADLSDDMRELVAEVRRLDSAATPGPLDVFGHERSSLCHVETDADAPAAGIVICSINKKAQNGRGEANALAYCRNAAPILATEVERLSARLAEVERERDEAVATLKSMLRDMAAVERMFPDEAPTSPPALAAEVETVETQRDEARENNRQLRLDIEKSRLALAAERGRLGALLELVQELCDPSPCWYDHHGRCQEHRMHDRPCPHEKASELLAAAATAPS